MEGYARNKRRVPLKKLREVIESARGALEAG
jgi:hypothetical protein